MGSKRAIIVVDSRSLIREALKSLMAKYGHHVVCDVASAAEIGATAISEEPELAILGVQSTDTALSEAAAFSRLWPACKIVLLIEHTSPADFQKLLTSRIDGCIPLFASPDVVIRTLDLIWTEDVRVMILGDAERSVIQPAPRQKAQRSEIRVKTLQSNGTEHEAVSVSVVGAARRTEPPVIVRNFRGLSEREVEILNGLVRGQANKVIARSCDISEATVKVHMKAILRKIRVANRTQAAIWAMEHGYTGQQDAAR